MIEANVRVLRDFLMTVAFCCVATTCTFGEDPPEVSEAAPGGELLQQPAPRASISAAGRDLRREAARISVSDEPAADSLRPGIRGRVTVRGSGLAGVPVELRGSDGEVYETRSYDGRNDQVGFFGFEGVRPGTYTLRLRLRDPSGLAFADSVRRVRVPSAGARAYVPFRGDLSRDSRVEGIVRDTDGDPLANVRVALVGDALEGYPADIQPTLDALPWSASTVSAPDGRFSVSLPPGWYRIRLWRDPWLESRLALEHRYRSRAVAVAPGETVERNLIVERSDLAECVVGQTTYGATVERDEESMPCGESLHPAVTRFEIWTFEGEAGDEVRVSTTLDGPSPLLLMSPDGLLVGAANGEGGRSDERDLRAILERDGTYGLVVTHSGPAWKLTDPYSLHLRGLRGTSPRPALPAVPASARTPDRRTPAADSPGPAAPE